MKNLIKYTEKIISKKQRLLLFSCEMLAVFSSRLELTLTFEA
jgi:hypothetical protein